MRGILTRAGSFVLAEAARTQSTVKLPI
jgi:hypothetical protein